LYSRASAQEYKGLQEHYAVGFSPFGFREARLSLEGTEIICGLPFSSASGNTYEEKINAIKGMGVSEFATKIKAEGFIAPMNPGDFVVIPTNTITINVVIGKDTVHGMRWSLLGNNDNTDVTIASLIKLHQSYGDGIAKNTKDIIDGLLFFYLYFLYVEGLLFSINM
jgi:hypothetical protein